VIWQTLLACFSPAIYRRDSFAAKSYAIGYGYTYTLSTKHQRQSSPGCIDCTIGCPVAWKCLVACLFWTNHSSRRARRSGRYAGEPRYRRSSNNLAAPGRRLNIMNLIDMGAYSLSHRRYPQA